MRGRSGQGAAQPAALGAALADELLVLLQDDGSFLKRLSSQFFQMLHEERARVSPELAQQVGGAAGGDGCGLAYVGGGGGSGSRSLYARSHVSLPVRARLQAAAVSGTLQRCLGWGVAVVTDLDSEGEDEDGPVVVEGVLLPPDADDGGS